MKRKSLNINKGAVVLQVVFALLFFLMLGRFLHIQVSGKVSGVDVQQFTADWFRDNNVLEGKRGSIFDANGRPLAIQTISYTLAAIVDPEFPNHVVNKEMTSEKLAPLIGMTKEDVFRALTEPERFQVEFGANGSDLSYTEMRTIEALELPGIIFRSSTSRSYPNGKFLSHVLGYAVRDKAGGLVGEMGLEKVLNDQLDSKDGMVEFATDGQMNILPNEVQNITPPVHGNNVYLTIDATIQGFIEAAVRQVEETYRPEEIIVIAQEAKTGRILGMATSPSFNPNKRDMTQFTNIAVESSFQPGSTMKTFAWAAAIDAGVYNGGQYFQSGQFYATRGDDPIRDHNEVGWGSITLNEGFYRSSNVAASIIGMNLLGPERAKEYLNAFGLFDQTGIDLPNEAQGTAVFTHPRDQAVTMIGQGSTTTAIAMVRAMSAIANDGEMMQPFIIDKIVEQGTGKVIEENKPTVVGNPISAAAAKETRDLLAGVVNDAAGTGYPYRIEGFDVIGKTGTAEIFNEHGQVITGRANRLFSFLGMAPHHGPDIILYVSVKKPNITAEQVGSQPVSEIFNYVMENSLRYRNIPRSTSEETMEELADQNTVEVEDYEGFTVAEAESLIQSKGLLAVVIGDGEKAVFQLPRAETKVIIGSRVFLLTDGNRIMPDISGWSVADVMSLAELLEIEVKVEGSGFVTQQSIEAGTSVRVGSILQITSTSRP